MIWFWLVFYLFFFQNFGIYFDTNSGGYQTVLESVSVEPEILLLLFFG